MTSVTVVSLGSIPSLRQDAGHAPAILRAAQTSVMLKQEDAFAKTMLKASTVRDANLDFLIWSHLILRAAHPASALAILLCAQMLLATVFMTSPPPFRLMRMGGAWSREMARRRLWSGPQTGKILP